MPEEGGFQITAMIPNRNIQGSQLVMLVNRGFTIALDTTRATYLTGEPFQVRVTARSRDQKRERVEKPLQLSIQKQNDEGVWTNVETKKVTTSADERRIASVSFTMKEGGNYRIYAEGTDRRGTQVSAQKSVIISGEDDWNKVLILSDQSRYQQGESAEFTVVSRLPENLCLLMGEREGVVEYRIETLKKGKNEISWKLDDRYSPHAVVSLIVMYNNQYYHREAHFDVHRGMEITITPDSESYKPREEVKLTVETRDHTGKPVVSELSLGLVDEALLALFPDQLGDLAAHFDQAAQGRFLNTSSSAGFSYDGITRLIDREALEVADKEEGEYLREEESRRGLSAGRRYRDRAGISEEIEAVREVAAAGESRSRFVISARDSLDAALAPGSVNGYYDKNAEGLMRLGGPGDQTISADFSNLVSADNDGNGIVNGKRLYAGATELQVAEAPAIGQMALGDIPVRGSIPVAGGMFGGGFHSSTERYGNVFFAKYAGYGVNAISNVTRKYFPRTAYFNPSVITDEEGRAVVTIPLPDSLTSWEAQVKAITKDTLVNQAQESITVDKPFRVEIDAPEFLVEGDDSTVTVLTRNNTAKGIGAQSEFTQTHAGQDKKTQWAAELETNGVEKHTIAIAAANVGETKIKMESRAGDLQDALEKSFTVAPYGVPVRVGASALAGQDQVETLSLPSQADYSQLKMWITIGGAGDLSLLAPVWSNPMGTQSNRAIIEKGLAALAVLDCVERLKRSESVPVEALNEQAEAAVRHAVAAQSNEGLWAWSGGNQNQEDIITTGRAAELLQKAKERGFTVPDKHLESAASKLMALYQSTANDSEKARLLYALSTIRPPEFTYVNRIHRNLSRLEAYEAALLGLTWFNMDRIEKAREVLNHLLSTQGDWAPDSDEGTTPNPLDRIRRSDSQRRNSLPSVNRDEILALVARLYFQMPIADRMEEQTQRFLDALSSHSAGSRIFATLSFGARMQALAAYLSSAAEETNAYTVTVKINDREIARRQTTRSILPYERIDVDPAIVKSSGNRVEFQFAGMGKFRYSCVLEGWTKQAVQPQDWMEPHERLITRVERDYTHGPLTYKNQTIPRGYSVVEGSYSNVVNTLEEIAPGDKINVRLRIGQAQHDLDYVVVEDRIPAGCLLLEDTLQGPVDHFEQKGNTLTLYLRGPRGYFSVQYQLLGRYTGSYRVPPAIVSAAEEPGTIFATGLNEIDVLREGETPKMAYQLTPDELYHLGLRYFDDGLYKQSQEYLTQLFNEYTLRSEPYLETAKRLFQIHLKGNHSEELVRFFEIIKERDREYEIQFDQIAKLARAYRNIGEAERAVYVYRSLLDGLFLQEGAVSGTLQETQRYREALDYTKQLIMEYPDIPPVQTAVYTTGTLIYQKVDEWARDPGFLKAGNDKKSLLADAVGMIESFLALYPNHPIADEAGYTLINLWLDQKNYETVARLCETFSKRYPKSTFLDSYDYLSAYSLFQLERYEDALKFAQKVSTSEYPAPGGGVKKSDDTPGAILMAGKILHTSGELDKALKEYERVKESFFDAFQSIEYLTEKGLEIDDVQTFKTGEPASITLRHKNMDRAELRVYKVDLMTFYLTERDLERMTRINLAGIHPETRREISLEDSGKFEWDEETLELSLPDPGAYLVVVSGNGLLTSGMILRSDLEMEAQEDAQQGIVRVNVRSGDGEQYAKDVKIQVRGSHNEQFVKGKTDLRGVFTATGIQGTATVLAQAGDQYGFYQGTQSLGQAPEEAEKRKGISKKQAEDNQVDSYDALFNNSVRLQQVQGSNFKNWSDVTDPSNNRLSGLKASTLY